LGIEASLADSGDGRAVKRRLPVAGSSNADGDATRIKVDDIDLSFKDHQAAFKSKTNFELLRGYMVFTLCSSSYLVQNNKKVSGTRTCDVLFS
jgi:hypothetical protein